MKKINLLLKTILAFTVLTFVGCEKEEYKLGEIKAPSAISISAEIVGADADNPNGDGTGVVHFTATGSDVITWKFIHNGVERMVPSGKTTYAFSQLGLNTYTVSAVAIGAGGSTSDSATNVDVLATYNPPAELITKLTTGVWRVASEEGAHMGVGPNDASDPVWWAANPNDKASSGLYDDRYTFNSDGTFTFSAGGDSELFGKVIPLERDFGGDRGQVSVANNEHENYPVTQDDVDKISGTWYITAPGGVETLNFSGLGHVGFYIGSHSFEILDRSASQQISLKNYFADEGNAWWWKITNKE